MKTSVLTQIQGSWMLESMRFKDQEGKDVDLYGNAPIGIAMFDATGYMNAQLGAGNRPDFKSDVPAQGLSEEISDAFKSYMAFYGRYSEQSPGVLLVKLEGSLFPNWQGKEIIRFAEVKGDRLLLTTPPTRLGDHEIVVSAVWKKIK